MENEIRRTLAARRLDGLYEQSGANDPFMLRVRNAGGRWKANDLETLAGLAERWGNGRLHFTTRGDIEVHGLRLPDVDRVLDLLRQAGLTTYGSCGDTVRNVVACPGAGICPNELFDAGTLVGRIASEFTGRGRYDRLPRKFKISVSGCERACGSPQIQDVGIVGRRIAGKGFGDRVGMDVYLAGGLGRHPMLARRMLVGGHPEGAVHLIRACLECFDELGDRKRRHRGRLKFLAERIGHEALLARIQNKIQEQGWTYQI